MFRLALLASLLVLLALPEGRARACSPPPPGVDLIRPGDGATVGSADALFLRYYGSGSLSAYLVSPTTEDRPLTVRNLGPAHAVVDFPEATVPAGGFREIEIRYGPSGGSPEVTLIRQPLGGPLDVSPPQGPSRVEASASYREAGPCSGSGWEVVLRPSIDAVDAEGPIVGYALVELLGNDRPEVRSFYFVPESGVLPALRFGRFDDFDDLRNRCFGVAAIDRAGRLSPLSSNPDCVDESWRETSPDAGTSPDLGGAVDDAGVAADAGGGEGLALREAEGCTCGRPEPQLLDTLLVLAAFALLAFAARRRERPDRGPARAPRPRSCSR